MEHQCPARLSGRRDDPALLYQLLHHRLVQGPERVGGGLPLVLSCPASSTPWRWRRGIGIGGPLIGITSSRKTKMFIARGSGMPLSRAQVPPSWGHRQTSPVKAALALILNWRM
jgi:hypothetical protein